jgi:PBP1b-binding outer membrane lipoprotein LpoB
METKIKTIFIFVLFLSGCSATINKQSYNRSALKCIDSKNKKELFFSKNFQVSDKLFLKDTRSYAQNNGKKITDCVKIMESDIPFDELTQ